MYNSNLLDGAELRPHLFSFPSEESGHLLVHDALTCLQLGQVHNCLEESLSILAVRVNILGYEVSHWVGDELRVVDLQLGQRKHYLTCLLVAQLQLPEIQLQQNTSHLLLELVASPFLDLLWVL